MPVYITILAASMLAALLLTPLARRVALLRGIVDVFPAGNTWRRQMRPSPSVGHGHSTCAERFGRASRLPGAGGRESQPVAPVREPRPSTPTQRQSPSMP